MPMTLEKAIEITSDSANRGITTFNQDYKDALNLTIEAAKRLRDHRNGFPLPPSTLLPGETIEETKIISDQPGESHIYQKGG